MKINSIGIHHKVKDFKKSVKFYQKLGFKKVFEFGPNCNVKENYSGMIFEHGNCKLEIADGHLAVKKEVFKESIKSSKISLMINVNKLSEVVKICKMYKIPISVEPRYYHWGTLELVIKDPDELVLVFIAPYKKREAEKFGLKSTVYRAQAS